LVSRGPAVSFGFVDTNSSAFITFTVIRNAIAVVCRDSGRNVSIVQQLYVFPLTHLCRLSIAMSNLMCMLPAKCPSHFRHNQLN
jgi:hypothetical protein